MHYSYDGLDVVREVKQDGSSVEYGNGLELDDHLWQRTSAGATHYFITDHQGSTRALVDVSGNVASTVSYDTFGNGFSSSLTSYGYTGREHDSETGLLYYRARWYDPAQGRFVNEDPIGLAGGINFYAYVGNDPGNWVDPVGLWDRGNWKPPSKTGTRIGSGLGVLGGLALTWGIWNAINPQVPNPMANPQATPAPTPALKPQPGAGGAGRRIVGNCRPSSKGVKQAVKDIENGKDEVTVENMSEAAEVFLGTFGNEGFPNTTGMTGNEVRKDSFLFPDGKYGTYHWDMNDTQHGGRPHLQVHDLKARGGRIIRIFFKKPEWCE